MAKNGSFPSLRAVDLRVRPLARAETIPSAWYTDPRFHALDRDAIFATTWQQVADTHQLAQPGDHVIADVAGEPIIVVRGKDGALRAFFNVCRHRGGPLAMKDGTADMLICKYHGWTYRLDGMLRGVPHFNRVELFDKRDYGLTPVHLAVWEGLVFVNLGERPKPLETYLKDIRERVAPTRIGKLTFARRIEYDVRANWKLIFENYSECYHCPLVHPALSKLTPYDSAENDLCEGPFLGGFMPITKGHSLTMSGNACAPPVGDIKAGDHHRVFYYSIFPNLLLSLHPDYVMVHQAWPQSPARTILFCDWFFHPDAFGRPDFHPDDAVEFWDMTNRQDWHVCELSQQGIASRAYQPGPYSPRESIPAAWDREYLRALG